MGRFMQRMSAGLAAVTIAALLSGWAGAAQAHGLNVFAFVEGDEVVVEAKFSNGRAPVTGDVQVIDAEGHLVARLTLEADGTLRFPLDPQAAEAGLTIEVSTGDGHDDYWILTPEDIARGSGS